MTETLETGPVIVTEGSGWHEQPADRAELDVRFSATARTRADAVGHLGRRMAGAARALELPGLEVRHRRLWVQNEWRGNRVVGCRAGEDLALLIVDLSVLEQVLAALIEAEPTDLHGPRWVLADPVEAYLEAQARAVDDARQRAEGYAAALGGALGPLRHLSEVPEHAVPMRTRAMRAAESAGPDVRELGLEPEPVRVSARCTTTWTFVA